jgi:hypothetical protein
VPLRPDEKYHRRPACVAGRGLEIVEERLWARIWLEAWIVALGGNQDTGETPMIR